MKKIIFAIAMISFNASAYWSTSYEKDPMTDITNYYATSESKPSIDPMQSPYNGTVSWVGVGCNTKGESWAFFGFSSKPNMTNDSTEDGYSSSNRRIRWGNSLQDIKMTQSWGSKFLHVSDDQETIVKLKSYNSVILDMSDWHSSRGTYFKYDLGGSSKSINSILKKCGVKSYSSIAELKKHREGKLLKSKREYEERRAKELIEKKRLEALSESERNRIHAEKLVREFQIKQANQKADFDLVWKMLKEDGLKLSDYKDYKKGEHPLNGASYFAFWTKDITSGRYEEIKKALEAQRKSRKNL